MNIIRWCLLVAIAMPAYGQHAERRSVLTRNDQGTFWQFTPEQPYHSAAVRVSAGSAGGSGTLVGTDGPMTLMITNHHVVEVGNGYCAPIVTTYTRDGQSHRASFLQATPREDIAIYRIDRADLPCVAISAENAPAGAVIDTMGFGGPLHHKTAFRPFLAKTVPTERAVAVDAPSISGDSGSGMIWRGVLVGVNWGADSTPTQTAGVSDGNGIPLVYPATSSADANFLNRFTTQACAPYGCRPIIGRPGYLIPRGDQKWERQPREFPGPEQFYRPEGTSPQPTLPSQPITQPTPSQPVVSSPSDLDCPCTNLVDITEKVVDRIAKDDSLAMKLRGPRGEMGPAGPSGKDGEVSQAHLASIVTAVVKSVKDDPAMRGPQGIQGPPGKDGQSVTPEQLAALKAELLAEIQHPNIRVVIGNGGKIVDDETYRPGEPIVLDIEALVRAANAK